MNMIKGIRAMLLECMGMQAGETVLIVVDPPALEIGLAMWETAQSLQGEAMLFKMGERQHHAEEPPAAVAAAMRAAEIILAPTKKSLSHTRARHEACAAGARMASMPGITPGIITRSLAIDYSYMRHLSLKLAELLSAAKKAKLTSALGTDLELSLEGRAGLADTGDLSQPGAFGNLPAGEAYIAPLEGKSRGVFYCDASVGGFGRVTEPLRCLVKDGFLSAVEGGKVAGALREKLREVGRLAENIAELGIGTNPHTPLSGNPLEDEKVFGTVHLGIGNNKNMGGTIETPFHIDFVLKRPTLHLDGQPILQEGKFVHSALKF